MENTALHAATFFRPFFYEDVYVHHLIGKEQMVNTSKVVNYTHKFSKTSVTNGFKETSSTKGERNRCVDQNTW